MRVLFFLATLVCFTAVAPVGSTAKVKIKTSAICGMCKDAIESALLELPGVKSAVLDLTTRKVKVKYDKDQITLAQLRQGIAAAGYDADDIPALPRAYDALPGCCKKDSECAEPE
jgi:periplasmic mercuric ion binding protein